MPGLVPGIFDFLGAKDVDGRDKPGYHAEPHAEERFAARFRQRSYASAGSRLAGCAFGAGSFRFRIRRALS